MTLLITAVSDDYVLSCSDTRISVQSGKRFLPVDEKFNKHIFFHSNGLTAEISCTGLARWQHQGKTIKLYDIISNSLAEAAKQNLAFGPLCLNLISDLKEKLNKKKLKNKKGELILELHIVGYHRELPLPLIGVISTFRTTKPWLIDSELQKEYEFSGINFYVKAAESPEVIYGGMNTVLTVEEKNVIYKAVSNGADAFNVSKLAAKTIKRASSRTKAIGPRSVSVLIPKEGFVDTNLWEDVNGKIIGFMPRMVFPDGNTWGPSEFAVDLNLVTQGYLPRQSLFFKSIISQKYKRKNRRIIFNKKKGEAVPGIMGLIGLSIYGKVPDGYTDFGLSHG